MDREVVRRWLSTTKPPGETCEEAALVFGRAGAEHRVGPFLSLLWNISGKLVLVSSQINTF